MFKDKLFFLEGCYTLISVSLPDLLPQNFNCILFCKKLSFLEGHCTIKYFLNFCYTYFFPGHKQHFILQRVIFLRGMLHLNIFFFIFFSNRFSSPLSWWTEWLQLVALSCSHSSLSLILAWWCTNCLLRNTSWPLSTSIWISSTCSSIFWDSWEKGSKASWVNRKLVIEKKKGVLHWWSWDYILQKITFYGGKSSSK